MAFERKWLGTNAMWTSERPCSLPGKGLPQFALLDPMGKIVLSGNSARMKSQIESEIDKMLRQPHPLVGAVPKTVLRPYLSMDRGQYAKALKEANKVIAKPGRKNPEKTAEAAKKAAQAIQDKFSDQVKRVQWLRQNGYPSEAYALYSALKKGSKGNQEFESQVASLKTLFEGDEWKQETRASTLLSRLESSLYKSGPSPGLKKGLQQFMQKYGETTVSKRAQALAGFLN